MLVEKDIPDGEVPIFDMANFTLKHLSKINLSVLKKYMVYTQVGKFILIFINLVIWARKFSLKLPYFIGSTSNKAESYSSA